MKSLFLSHSRRSLLTKIFSLAGFSGALCGYLKYAHGSALKVTRVVHFPQQLSQDEFELMSTQYCDHLSIRQFTDQLISQQKITTYEEDFSSDHFVKYTIIFSDIQSYNEYLKTIDEKWFDIAKFEQMGFSVNIKTNSHIV